MRARALLHGLLALAGSTIANSVAAAAPALTLLTPGGVAEGDTGARALPFGMRWTPLPGVTGAYQVQWQTTDGSATAGNDYVAASGTATLSPQQTFVPLSVMVLGDEVIEPNEDIRIVYQVVGAAISGNGALWISDDDGASPPPPPPTVLIQALDASVTEPTTGVLDVGVMLLRLGPNNGSVDVDFNVDASSSAAHGQDWTGPTAGRIQFAPGQTMRRIDLAVLADAEQEGIESIRFSLATAAPALLPREHATVTIRDRISGVGAGVGIVACRRALLENDGPARVVVRRHGDSGGALELDYRTVDGSARAGADYTAISGTLSWVAGDATPRLIDITLATDSQIEPPESFTVQILDPQPGVNLAPAGTGIIILDAHDQILIDDFAPGCDDPASGE